MIIIRKKHFDNNMKVHNSKHGLKHKGDKEGNNKQCTY